MNSHNCINPVWCKECQYRKDGSCSGVVIITQKNEKKYMKLEYCSFGKTIEKPASL